MADAAAGEQLAQRGDMVKSKLLSAALGALVAALWATSAAPGFTGPPLVNEHYKFTTDSYAENWCGQVEGTAVDTVDWTRSLRS